ncbi:MAG: enoyl-CoA hydratase family protein [Propionibacteriales bacterium]|nr:enoyl-CoA hydratase family protein [Propionibacteriales bacterium]
MNQLVRLDVAGEVATITLDSPENRNALSRVLVTQLSESLQSAGEDGAVKVVVLTSSQRVFCAGADLSEAVSEGMDEGTRAMIALFRWIVALPKPVVARVEGPVLAGGIGIIGACDAVVASTEASFAFTEVRLGLTPAVISLTVLPRLADRAAALTFLGGGKFGGEEAARIGLVTRAVAPEGVDDAMAQVVGAFCKGSPQGLRETKGLLNARLLTSIDERGDELARLSARLFGSEEARAAMRAFLEKRAGG